VTNLVTDLASINAAISGKVAKAGDTMTGGLAAPDLAAVAAGLRLWLRNVGAFNRIDSYNDPITATQPLLINSALLAFLIGDVEKMRLDGLGRFGIGTDAPETLLDVNGMATVRSDLRVRRDAYPKTIWDATGNGVDQKKWQAYPLPGTGEFRIAQLNDAENAELSTGLVAVSGGFKFSGGLYASGDIGSAIKVMTGGFPAAWKTLAELGVGKKIIAVGTANSGDTITFATTEPDTSYSGVVLNGVASNSASNASTLGFGSLSSKGTGGCVVNSGNSSGEPGMTATNPVFYIIFRNT
jgi:hypothetical protein